MAQTTPPTPFDAAAFRTGLTLAMTMGAAVNTDEQISFHFKSVATYSRPVDADDVPFDPSATVTRTAPAAVKVPCSVDYLDANEQPVVFGTITPSRVLVTLLDEDYAQVKGCSYVVIAGEKYDYLRTKPPGGLFDVGLYEMIFKADGEA